MIDKDAKNEPGGLLLGATPHGVKIWKNGKGTLVDIFSTGCRALGLARN